MNGPRIRLIQSTLGDGDVAANLNQALALIAQCAGQVDLVVFSETYIPGFPTPQNVARLAEPLDGPSLSALRDAARQAGVSVAIGLAERDGERFYNTAVLIDHEGGLLLSYRKTHLYESDRGVQARRRVSRMPLERHPRGPADLLRHRIPRDRAHAGEQGR